MIPYGICLPLSDLLSRIICRSIHVAVFMHAKLLQLSLILCDPVDYSPPGSSVHGILQARILEWVAMPSSRGSFRLRTQTPVLHLQHWQAGSLPLVLPGKPRVVANGIIPFFLMGV